MATIVQRAMNNAGGGDDGSLGISDAEKQQLLEEIQKFNTGT
jgi:hypothetical protein